jgi:hypothetical protein
MLPGAQWLLKIAQPLVDWQANRVIQRFQYLVISGSLEIARTKTSYRDLFDKPWRYLDFCPTQAQRTE